jgi:tRNA pseudouridine38-40 synthase
VRNIKLTLQYDGTNFSGFELQRGKRTIRGEIEKALSKLFKTKIKIISASRTDAGVHALSQVVNFRLKHPIETSRLVAALNSCLPEEIRAVGAEEKEQDKDKDQGFNSRYSAKNKEYEYLIFNGGNLLPFYRKFVWHVKPKLDLASMRKAAKILEGKHDFSSFCASGSDDKNFVRNLYKISIRKRKIKIWDNSEISVVSFKLKGNGFLYKMVRNMVGTLVEVGLGKINLTDVRRILRGRDRRLAGRTAPAHGLCLVKINFDDIICWKKEDIL